MATDVKLHESWRTPLAGEFQSPYMQSLKSFLVAEKAGGKRVFPKGGEWFRALDLTPLDEVRVVILGQDPYHGAGQAHGLCFSRSEEHTSELQSLMRISYAVFCLKKNK